MSERCCIADYCGRRYDPDTPETRDVSTLRSFWKWYCPVCRVKGNAGTAPIVEQRGHDESA